ncbi:MAG: ComEA family DNA-binding protein [Candidatus Methylomirabilia bacterium]
MIGNTVLALFLSFVMSLAALPAWAAKPAPRLESVAVQDGTVNVNTASKAELMQLNGVGSALADRIIEYRNAHGPFEKPEDIQKVRGIGKVFWQRNQNAIAVK